MKTTKNSDFPSQQTHIPTQTLAAAFYKIILFSISKPTGDISELAGPIMPILHYSGMYSIDRPLSTNNHPSWSQCRDIIRVCKV